MFQYNFSHLPIAISHFCPPSIALSIKVLIASWLGKGDSLLNAYNIMIQKYVNCIEKF